MDTKLIAIIDVDSIVWSTAYLNREDDSQMLNNLDEFLNSFLTQLEVTHYVGFLGNSSITFRHAVPTYKANRPERPEYFQRLSSKIIQHLVSIWKFQIVEAIEADDACSILAARLRKENTDYIVCSVDKDLQQIPGKHYNYNTSVSSQITTSQAKYSLFYQCLVGDTTDNIGGCPGIGKAKAPAVLGVGEEDFYSNTIDEFIYRLDMREGLAKFAETYLLVRLLEDYEINIPIIKYENSR